MHQRLLTLMATVLIGPTLCLWYTLAEAEQASASPCASANEGRMDPADDCYPRSLPKTAGSDESRYAELEAKTPNAQEYRGGDTVIIGATTATIVLAVILLIVIL